MDQTQVALIAGDDRVVHGGEGLLGADRIVAEAWDAQQAPVGREADLLQGRQTGQPVSAEKTFLCVSGAYPLGRRLISPCVIKIG
jgi:hypothetical protein